MNNLAILVAVLIGTMQDVARQSGFIFNLTSPPEGFIPDSVALNQEIQYADIPLVTGGDFTPAMAVPDPAGITLTGPKFKMDQSKYRAFKLTAEEELGLGKLGPAFRSVAIEAAIAGLMEDAAAYIGAKMIQGAGLAHGTPGTDPFATNPNILSDAWRTMADDKAPEVGRYAALSTVDFGSASKLTQFQKLSEAPAGTKWATMSMGMLANWNTGYDQASGLLQTTVAAGSYLVNFGAGYAAGTKTIVVDTGTGAFAPGDIVTVAGNFETGTATLAQMVVASWNAGGSAVTFTRGLLSAVADNAALVRIATNRSSLLGHRAATLFAARPSADLMMGDAAKVVVPVFDSKTGFGFRLAYYGGWGQGAWFISTVYGGLVRRPEWLRRVIR